MRRILLSNPETVEFIMGLAWMVLGGTLLIWPGVYANAAIYKVLSLLLSQIEAGVLFTFFGTVIWGALIIGNLNLRRLSMILSAAWFTAFTMFFVLSGPTTGTIYMLFVIQSIWCYLRLGIKH